MPADANDLVFTTNWFEGANAPKTWQVLTPRLPARLAFLEIGVFEGQATAWIVENLVEDGGEIVCIDTFAGDETLTRGADGELEARFDHNVGVIGARHPARRVDKRKGLSFDALSQLVVEGRSASFDFVYVDGSHLATSVLTDACMAWQLLKPGGIMVFDDYLWGNRRDILHRPKLAIDMFLNIFSEDLAPIFIAQQLAVQKLAEPAG